MAMERDNRAPRGRKRRKVCAFCVDKVECFLPVSASSFTTLSSTFWRLLENSTVSSTTGVF